MRGLGIGVWGLGFRVSGFGIRVMGFGVEGNLHGLCARGPNEVHFWYKYYSNVQGSSHIRTSVPQVPSS